MQADRVVTNYLEKDMSVGATENHSNDLSPGGLSNAYNHKDYEF